MQDASIQASDFDTRDEGGEVRKTGGAFRTISEVAEELGVQQHVLRFWETKFSQIRPMKRGGGRRYYRPEDVALLKHIHTLLYSEGYTIKGAQKLLKGQSKGAIAAEAAGRAQANAGNIAPISSVAAAPSAPAAAKAETVADAGADLSPLMVEALQGMLKDLKELRALVGKAA
ncbi:MAG: MerR family transcriptional regulator [Rhodospirillales bacterium]|nr:MerR family transcriptional regulator [Alphaproteobacteria bacterium]MCB9987182.1 MerR family transcriptional regulator [Rhodospirillales bacterium]USO07955.1 MAG: MerR family transcriptional regulator [Rhodospirillales bacterium]